MPVRREHIAKDTVETEDIVDNAVTRPKIQGIKWETLSISVPAIAPGGRSTVDVAVAGMLTTDHLLAIFNDTLSTTVLLTGAIVPSDGTIRFLFLNPGASPSGAQTQVVAYARLVE